MVEGHENIKMSNSIIDYVFRALGLEYLNRTDIVQNPPNEDMDNSDGETIVPVQESEIHTTYTQTNENTVEVEDAKPSNNSGSIESDGEVQEVQF